MRRWLDRWFHTERLVPPMSGRDWARYLAVVLVAGPAALGLALLAGWALSPLPLPAPVRLAVTFAVIGGVARLAAGWLPAAEQRRAATAEAYLIGAILVGEAAVLYFFLA